MPVLYTAGMSQFRPETKINLLIIHCAATPNGRWNTSEDIDQWHSERGFRRNTQLIGYHQPKLKHIGYHFVINTKGAVECGRSLTETGAHARGHNFSSIGTCLIGTDRFSMEQWISLKNHVEALENRFPGLKIIGHRQVNPHKTCPGFDVSAWLEGDKEQLSDHLL